MNIISEFQLLRAAIGKDKFFWTVRILRERAQPGKIIVVKRCGGFHFDSNDSPPMSYDKVNFVPALNIPKM